MDVQSFTPSIINSGVAQVLTSGTSVTISGLERDGDFGLVYNAEGAGTFTVYSGEYQNADQGNYTYDVGDSSTYVWPKLDGSRYRKEDGSIVVESHCSGNIYAWTL